MLNFFFGTFDVHSKLLTHCDSRIIEVAVEVVLLAHGLDVYKSQYFPLFAILEATSGISKAPGTHAT